MGRLPESIQELKAAVSLQPDLALAHFNLGHSYLLTGQSKQAIESLKAGLAIKEDPMAAYALGEAFQQAGKQKEAESAFQEALRIDPNLKQARDALERILNN